MQETLRLHPPAPVRGRTLNEDDTILGYKLPKGSHVTYVSCTRRLEETRF